MFESLGATPTPMAMSDIYTALQQGTIDGAENPLPVILNGAYQEVAKNLVLDAHTYDMTCWIMGADYFHTPVSYTHLLSHPHGSQRTVIHIH